MILRIQIFFLLVNLASHLPAQTVLLDSFAMEASKFTGDSLGTQLYIRASKDQIRLNRNLADTLLQIAQARSDDHADRQQAQILSMRAQIAVAAGEYKSAADFISASNAILESIDPEGDIILTNLNNEGLIHYYQGKYDAALVLFFKRLNIAEVADNLQVQLRTLNNIGISYERLDANENALIYYDRALSISENNDWEALQLANENQRQYYIASINANIGNIFFKENKYSEALRNFQNSYDIAKAENNKPLHADEASNLGRTLMALKRHEESALFNEEALALANELNEPQRIIVTTLNLAENLLRMGQTHQAIERLLKARDLAESKNIQEQIKPIYQELQRSYTDLKNFEEALNYAGKLSLIKDSLYTAEQIRITEELNAKYQAAEKEITLSNQELVISQQNILRNRLLIGLLFLSLGSGFMWYRHRAKQQEASQALLMQEQKIENLQQQQKLLALDLMMQGQEAERKRIAQDLHDGLGGILSSVRTKVANINRELATLEKINIIGDAEALIIKACDEVRRISHHMMPASLISLGLVDAIEDLIEDVRNDANIDVVSRLEINHADLSDGLQLQVYRIVQEFINNTMKHSQADNLRIDLKVVNNMLHLHLADNGTGYDIDAIDGLVGLGLKGITSRVKYLSGNLNDLTEIGQGCVMKIQLPISPKDI